MYEPLTITGIVVVAVLYLCVRGSRALRKLRRQQESCAGCAMRKSMTRDTA